jgi:hypothetical protein
MLERVQNSVIQSVTTVRTTRIKIENVLKVAYSLQCNNIQDLKFNPFKFCQCIICFAYSAIVMCTNIRGSYRAFRDTVISVFRWRHSYHTVHMTNKYYTRRDDTCGTAILTSFRNNVHNKTWTAVVWKAKRCPWTSVHLTLAKVAETCSAVTNFRGNEF